jgi:predicted nuclease with RNAse H fold
MIEPDWLYRLTANKDFPDPVEEVTAIGAICEEEGESFLLLGNRVAPPMCSAQSGQSVAICIGDGNRLIVRAIATIVDRPQPHSKTPESVVGLYGDLSDRMFCKIDNVQLRNAPLPTSVLSEEAQAKFLSGQPTVKQLTKPKSSKQVAIVVNFDASLLDSVSIELCIPTNFDEVVVGLDPTAATWESKMTTGIKKMPSFSIVIRNSKLILTECPLQLHLTNQEFWDRVKELDASCVCIDGPCSTNGLKLKADYTGWIPCVDHGKRASEVELTKQGVKLFWTTKNTVEKFDGASRWIARSIELFSNEVSAPKIETHPHGAFTFLWQALGQEDGLPPKSKPDGQAARLAILKKFLPTLTRDMVPDHDAMDAAAAALVAALHRLGKTKSFGSDEKGGLIWLPNVGDCVKTDREH